MTALTGTLLPAVAGVKGIAGVPSVVSDDKWTRFIGLVCTGTKVRPALKQIKISYASFEGRLSERKYRDQFNDSKVKALRVNWSEEVLEDVLIDIAMGSTVQAACEKAFMETHIRDFYGLIMRDPLMREAYDEARTIQAEKMAIDDIIEISDNTDNDETWDGKGNSAAVNRSRLKVDSRKWISGKLNFKRFGDKQQVDIDANIVIDHAARLEAARKRKENAFHERKKKKKII